MPRNQQGAYTTSGLLYKPGIDEEGRLDRTDANFDVLDAGVFAGTVSTSMSVSATIASVATAAAVFSITAFDTTSFTISSPTLARDGMVRSWDILNSSGTTMGTITWGTTFALAGAFSNPATGKRRTITFYYKAADTKWYELSRAAADI